MTYSCQLPRPDWVDAQNDDDQGLDAFRFFFK